MHQREPSTGSGDQKNTEPVGCGSRDFMMFWILLVLLVLVGSKGEHKWFDGF